MRIEIENLTKKIHGATVLEDISEVFEQGKIYGLSGKNGSGKTMLMRSISGLIKPTSGRILIDGKVLGEDFSFPPSIGVLIENPSFIPKYTGVKNLQLLAAIQNKISREDIDAALESVGLDPRDKRVFRKYSLGMKQRLGIACALMEKPDIVLLDEPINALDESGIILVKKLLAQAKERGAVIILSCHDKEELELLSDEILYMAEGKIVKKKTLKPADSPAEVDTKQRQEEKHHET